jgi:hypothetical protein
MDQTVENLQVGKEGGGNGYQHIGIQVTGNFLKSISNANIPRESAVITQLFTTRIPLNEYLNTVFSSE